jgi:hypothetical protein
MRSLQIVAVSMSCWIFRVFIRRGRVVVFFVSLLSVVVLSCFFGRGFFGWGCVVCVSGFRCYACFGVVEVVIVVVCAW